MSELRKLWGPEKYILWWIWSRVCLVVPEAVLDLSGSGPNTQQTKCLIYSPERKHLQTVPAGVLSAARAEKTFRGVCGRWRCLGLCWIEVRTSNTIEN